MFYLKYNCMCQHKKFFNEKSLVSIGMVSQEIQIKEFVPENEC